MKNIELHIFAVFFLVIMTLASIAVPTSSNKEFVNNNSYVMQEPFSSSPLITYPSLEAELDS